MCGGDEVLRELGEREIDQVWLIWEVEGGDVMPLSRGEES